MSLLYRLITLVASSAVLASCASTTLIKSEPSGAKLYVDGSYLGTTPYSYSDTKIVGSTSQITIKKQGCETGNFVLARSEKFEIGPCIGGALVYVPFLWIMGYNPQHTYSLECSHTKKSNH